NSLIRQLPYTHHLHCSFSLTPPPPTPTLFPYTTLFRSLASNDVNINEPAAPKPPCLSGTRDPSASHLSWKAPDNGGSNIVSYQRSEEHTSELQSRRDLVCRLLLEKKKKNQYAYNAKTNH